MEVLPFTIEVTRESDVQTIHLSGELDYFATLELMPQLDELVEDCYGELHFDLEHVTLIDSEGIKMLLKVFASVAYWPGRIRVVSCSKCAQRVIKMAGADTAFGMSESSTHPLAAHSCS